MKKIIKGTILFLIAFPSIFIINIDFMNDWYIKILQSVIFSLTIVLVFLWPTTRKYILSLSLGLIVIMAIFFILRLMYFSNLAGSTGVGLVVIVLIGYFPQLVKLGYIEEV